MAKKRARKAERQQRPQRQQPGGRYQPRVVVKFHDHVELPYDRSASARLQEVDAGAWNRLAETYKGITLAPLFSSRKREQLLALTEKARASDRTYDRPTLLAYFVIDVPPGASAEEIVAAVSKWPAVAVAYVEPGPVPPPVTPADDPRNANQGYLDPAPDGIDAEYAWGFAGGDGAGQALVDMEWGWTLTHEDLAAHGITIISGNNESFFFHGTGVLGEVAAVDNTVGCVGITPALASIRCVGQWLSGGGYSTSQPILDAIAVMNFGDVLLLEAQTSLWGYVRVPVEIEPAVFDAIQLATALGITVVEAGGNGGVDLDTVVDPGGAQIFNRAAAGFRDSGAIIVGAASSVTPHSRLGFSCFGSRIDCYGWGENVDTLSTDGAGTATNQYTTTFNGTSSASPIVTGAALAVQGLAQSGLGARFAPWQLRALLSDPTTGTASANPAVDRIGVMPNLRTIIDDVLNLAPDVYIRDFVGDTGDPHAGGISASPDVILRPAAVADPQTSFGEGSGTENDPSLGFEAEAGQDNFIYVRVRNRGGSPAANVAATVYWSPPSTLVTPDLWTLVDSTTLASVPAGDLLTVSNAITWPSAAIPGTGHYCFVALIGSAQDPAPSPADFLDWNNFTQFIRANNNVTWRNFNVVNNTPPHGVHPPGFVPLPFMAAGAPDKARRFGFEVVCRLPREAKVLLEVPFEFARQLRVQSVSPFPDGPKKSDKKTADRMIHLKKVAYIPINPSGRTRFEETAFPAKARFPMRLLVALPKAFRDQSYELFARQLFETNEVGRVTWRLVPDRARPKHES
jgi:serine protease